MATALHEFDEAIKWKVVGGKKKKEKSHPFYIEGHLGRRQRL